MHLSKEEIEDLQKRVKESSDNAGVHIPYAETSGRIPDFEVRYEFLPDAPDFVTQGARCDFLYEGDDPSIDGVHMIWPEFLDAGGEVIRDKTVNLARHGNATMWIVSDEARDTFHRNRLRIGTKGYWVVGSKKVAQVEVTRILGLAS